MIAAVFISDRKDLYLPECLASFNKQPQAVLVDEYHIVNDSEHFLGMAGAVKAGWAWALDHNADYVLHVEEDFLFTDLPLAEMLYVLDNAPHLAQVVLKRQPWSAEEVAAGGQIETNPDAYTQMQFPNGVAWVEHQTLFSVNPCLIPRRTLEIEWSVDHRGGVEAAITEACRNRGLSFAYYGRKADGPRCEHVGHIRAGAGWRW